LLFVGIPLHFAAIVNAYPLHASLLRSVTIRLCNTIAKLAISGTASAYPKRMKVAVPIWEGRVSPVLDVAQRIVLVEFGSEGECSREDRRLSQQVAKAEELAAWGVEVVLCSGVSMELVRKLNGLGLSVIPHLCGEVDEVLTAFRCNRLGDQSLTMPGCHHRHDHGEPLAKQPPKRRRSARGTKEGR